MGKVLGKRYNQPGTSPGALVDAPGQQGPIEICLVRYEKGNVDIQENVPLDHCTPLPPGDKRFTWIHIAGQPNANTLQQLGKRFHLGKMNLEDVLNSGQRPKQDSTEAHFFITLSLPIYLASSVEFRQFSLFLGETYIISSLERDKSIFNPIKERLKNPESRTHKAGVDYLAYALIDRIVDEFLPVLERIGLVADDLEERILEEPHEDLFKQIHYTRRSLGALHRALMPTREVIHHLISSGEEWFDSETIPYLRDCLDHADRALDATNGYRDITTSLMETYRAETGHRLNEIMRILAMISAIFIPLSFIAGLYGMNFNTAASKWNMPELHWEYGYITVLGLMVAVVFTMIRFFKRKGWM